MRAITNSDYPAHSAPLFAKLSIRDILQINSFQISKFMFYCHNQLLPFMFLNLFETSHQVDNYGTRIATIIGYIFVALTSNNLQFFIKVQKSGTLFLDQLLIHLNIVLSRVSLKKTELVMLHKHCVRLSSLMIGI